MDGGKMIEPMVKNVLDDLTCGKIAAGMYGVVNKHLETFAKLGITPADIRELLELKKKIVFLPEPFAYSLSRPGRGDYLLANFDSPSVVPLDGNEERFVAALHSYYQEATMYKTELEILSQRAEQHLKWISEYPHYQLVEEQRAVEDQKKNAIKTLVYYIGDLRSGQLTEEEMIEQCGKYDREMIDYVKVQRGIGIITPTIAYNSMHYFLSHRLYTEWDPEGIEVDNGEITGEYYYPNKNMKNPAEKFPPNLLNEMQWSTLGNKSQGEAAKFIPDVAYPRNRITGVQVYPSGNGELSIRCMVDGEQQGGKQLSEEDACRYKDERTDLNEMALGYFTEAFAWKGEKNVSLKR